MENGKAAAIFKQIYSDRYTDEEKIEAIGVVIDYETYSRFFKRDFMQATKWLHERAKEKAD